jgi:hypothetical protein
MDALVELIGQLWTRYGLHVSQRGSAKAVPARSAFNDATCVAVDGFALQDGDRFSLDSPIRFGSTSTARVFLKQRMVYRFLLDVCSEFIPA